MASLILRHKRYSARVRIPKDVQAEYGGRTHLDKSLFTSDRKIAEVEAAAWEAMLRLEWNANAGKVDQEPQSLRRLYDEIRRRAAGGEYRVDVANEEPEIAGIDYELEKLADMIGPERDHSPTEEARLAALYDARQEILGKTVKPRREYEPSFADVAKDFMTQWRTSQGLKETNTEQQKLATFNLFAGFWGDKPIRGVRPADAAAFHDALRRTDPKWARNPAAKGMSWAELQASFGGRPRGLADATMNRHMAALKALWDWAARRDFCSGHNPFMGFHRKLTPGRNVAGYLAWEPDELGKLFASPSKRADLREVILVGMFSGMRLDEIASLRWEQIKEEDGVTFIQVVDAKTPAGNRQVPLHSALGWLKDRRKANSAGRVWPTFNPEGPGKKAGADAGREFSRFKAAKGFTDRHKAFHSFRKNVTRQMERAAVPENEWAQVFGHEKGFTYGRYNPDGIALERKAAIIEIISYSGVALPEPGMPRPEKR